MAIIGRHETYRIVKTSGPLGPAWVAFRKQRDRVGHIYVCHAHTRAHVREMVAADRRRRGGGLTG